MDSLIKLLESKYNKMSKGQKKISDFICNSYDKATFMTAAKLGETVGVSESTVVRFAIELGFEGYPGFQEELRELIKSKLTSAQRLEVSSNRIEKDNVLKSVLRSDMNKIRTTLTDTDCEEFDKVVKEILKANKIYILGVRSSAALASFLGFYFNLIFENVRLVHTTSVSEMFEQVVNVEKGDVVIGISFPRYSSRTAQAMQFTHDQGATVIAITDSRESSIAKCSNYTLIAQSDMALFVDSLVAPLSLINALIVAVGLKRKDTVRNTLEKLETIWDAYNVYEKQDPDIRNRSIKNQQDEK